MSEWISVKDILPEYDCECLIADNGIVSVGAFTHEGFITPDDYIFQKCIEDDIYLGKASVTHWQPLPPPPEET